MEDILDDIRTDNNDERESWELFIQNNSSSIIPKWQKFKETNTKFSVNIFAAIFGFLWAGYRKMYLVSFLQIALFGFLFEFSEPLIIIVFFGYLFFGDWLYYNHAQKKLREIKQQNHTPNAYSLELKAKGGVSVVFPMAVALICMVLLLLLIGIISNMGPLWR